MFEQISRLEKLYAIRSILLQPRVLLVWVLMALALAAWGLMVLGLDWAFDWVWFFAVLAGVMFVWRVWPGYLLSSRLLVHRAKRLQKQGDGSAAYQMYQALNREAIWPREKASAKLALAWFMYQAGNYKRAFNLANGIANQVDSLSVANRVSWTFLQTFQLEQAQEYEKVLVGLDALLESVENPRFRMQAYNNRGRIYTLLHQLDFAQTEYEKAYALLKRKPDLELFSVIAHNLLLNYARQGLFDKADSLIEEYQDFVGKSHHTQWLEFSNDLLQAGREANHQAWLDCAYAIQRDIKPKNDEEAFALSVTALRVRLNDGREFDECYQRVMPTLKAQLEQNRYDLTQKLYVHRELMHVLRAKVEQTQGENPWFDDFAWLTKQSQSWLPLLNKNLARVDTSLVAEKVGWLKAKQRLLKDSLAFETDLAKLKTTISEVAKIQMRVINE